MGEDSKSSKRSAGFSSSLKTSAQEGLKDAVKEVVKERAVKIIGTALGVIALGSIPLLKEKACLPGWLLIVIGISGIFLGTALYAYFTRKRVPEMRADFEQQRSGLQGEIGRLEQQIATLSARPEAEQLKDRNELQQCIKEHLREVLELDPDRPRNLKPIRALSVAAITIDGFSEIARSYPFAAARQLLDDLAHLVLDERRGSSDSVYRLDELIYIVTRFEPAANASYLPDRVRVRAGGVSRTGPEGQQLPRWSVSGGVAEFDLPRVPGNDLEQRIQNVLDRAVAALKHACDETNAVKISERSP